LRNGDFHELYSSRNTVRVMREFRCLALGACGGEDQLYTVFWWRKNLKEKDHFKDLRTDGQIVLKFILKRKNGRAWFMTG